MTNDLTREQIAWNAGRDAAAEIVTWSGYIRNEQANNVRKEIMALQAPQFQPVPPSDVEKKTTADVTQKRLKDMTPEEARATYFALHPRAAQEKVE